MGSNLQIESCWEKYKNLLVFLAVLTEGAFSFSSVSFLVPVMLLVI
jgi:hypothetical protein